MRRTGSWQRMRSALAGFGATMVQGLALAGHGQWGFPWSPLDDPELEPGPGELSWVEFEDELHVLFAASLDIPSSPAGEEPRPTSEPMP